MLILRLPCQDQIDTSRCSALFVSIILLILGIQGFLNLQNDPDYYDNNIHILLYFIVALACTLFIYSFIRCINVEYLLIN